MFYMETQNIEYKESWRDEYLKWICGFANAQGGVLYIGLNDKGDVIGVDDAKRLLEDIPNKVKDILGIIVDVNLKRGNGKSYLEIVTEPYPVPVNYKGQYHYRSGSTKQELKGAALDRFMLRKQGKTWDGVPVPYLTVDDLDNEAFKYFRKEAIRTNRMEEKDVKVINRELLNKLRLVEGKYLKRAAALLFAEDPEKYVTGAYIKVGYFHDDADILFQDEIHGSLFFQVEKLVDLLTTKYMKAIIHYDNITRIDELPVPRKALREACLNAIIHKTYESNTPIQIRVYEDKIMIWNSGVLPEDWTMKDFLGHHNSRPYNPLIANAFFRSGGIEAWGRGIEKIFGACRAAKAPKPKYKHKGDDFWTIFNFKKIKSEVDEVLEKKKGNPQDATQESTQESTLKSTLKGTLKGTRLRIVEIILEKPTVTIPEIAVQLALNPRGIAKHISNLQNSNIIRRIGPDKGGYWEVVDK